MYEDTAVTYQKWRELGRQVSKGERATWVTNDMGDELAVFFFWQTYEPKPSFVFTETFTLNADITKKSKKKKGKKKGKK